jgi:hypothetical protein
VEAGWLTPSSSPFIVNSFRGLDALWLLRLFLELAFG